MANCIKCGAALPWAGKSCAFCGTPVSASENIEGLAVAAADSAADAAAVAVTAAALPASGDEISEAELADYKSRAKRRTFWGLAAATLGIAMLVIPIPTGAETERSLKAAAAVSWEGITAMIEAYSPALEQYSTIGQSGNWALFAIGSLITNAVYLATGLLLIVTGILGALRTRRLPRWALVTLPLVYVGSLLISFTAYYRLMEYVYTQLQGIPMLSITELFGIIFGVSDPGTNWGSLVTNVVVPLLVILVGLFGGSKDLDLGFDTSEADFEDFDAAEEEVADGEAVSLAKDSDDEFKA